MDSTSIKRMGKNTLIYSIGTICARATTFLLVPLYTHTLSIKEYGSLATLLITSALMVVLINFGMRHALLRFFNEYDKKGLLGTLLGTTTTICLSVFIIVISFGHFLLKSFITTNLSIHNPSSMIYLLCVASLTEALFLYIQQFYRAKSEPIKHLVIGLTYSILMVTLAFIALVILKLNLEGIFIAKILSNGLIVIIIFFKLILEVGFRLSLNSITKFLKYGFPLIFSMSSEFVLGAAAIYYLNIFTSLETVAIYSLSKKLAGVATLIFIYPFRLAFEPYVFSNMNSSKVKSLISKFFTLFILGYIIISFFLSIAMRLLMPIIAPPEYASAYFVLILMLPIVLFYGLYYFGEILINLLKKTHITGLIVTSATVFGVALYYILIKYFHLYGAIISRAIGYFLIGFLMIYFGMKLNKIKPEWNRIIIIIILLIINTTSFLLIHNIPNMIFYLITFTLIIINLLTLYFMGFLHKNEKELFKKLVLYIRMQLFKSL